jgi:hypothetical protein
MTRYHPGGYAEAGGEHCAGMPGSGDELKAAVVSVLIAS